MPTDYRAAAAALADRLGLASPPLAITFKTVADNSIAPYGAQAPEPTDGGRTGAVPAGCVFWFKAAARTFTTEAADHANCSVGSLTHGFRTLEEVAGNEDVVALVGAKWVTPEIFPGIPTVEETPAQVVYGPLAETPVEPDVVFIRLNGKQAMMLHDACPDIKLEGKPQCHIIPMAKEHNEIALSVGCMLSRVRTGMPNNEMTCAIPVSRLGEVIDALTTAAKADKTVAAYAAQDAKRFG